MGGKTPETQNFEVQYLENGWRFGVTTRLANSTLGLLWASGVYIFFRRICIFGDFSKILIPKMYPNRGDRYTEHFGVNQTQILAQGADWNKLCRSEAGIAIYFSNFWGKSFYRFRKRGNFPKSLKSNISETVQSKPTKLGGLQHLINSHTQYFSRFFWNGAGKHDRPQIFLDEFVNRLEKGEGSTYNDETQNARAHIQSPSSRFF